MELFKLDGSYLPGATVQGFESLIWTERYDVAGEFVLTFKDDISVLSKIPTGTLLSHTSTFEVMIVESYTIERDKEKNVKVEITGRSLETFAENRPTAGSDLALKDGSGNANAEVLSAMSSTAAAATILRYKLQPGTASSDDAIPNSLVTEDVASPDANVAYPIARGDVYSRVLELLKINKAGIKTVRPNGGQTTLNFVVHTGIDRRTTVIFYASQEDLEDAKYFKSIQKYKNYARIATAKTTRLYRHRDLGSDLTGLSRRIMYTEASDLEGTYSPPTSTDAVAGRAQTALDSNKTISLISATIADTAKPKFKKDYEVGDIITVFGEFQASQAYRVTEHILTVDSAGIRGHPSLSEL